MTPRSMPPDEIRWIERVGDDWDTISWSVVREYQPGCGPPRTKKVCVKASLWMPPTRCWEFRDGKYREVSL